VPHQLLYRNDIGASLQQPSTIGVPGFVQRGARDPGPRRDRLQASQQVIGAVAIAIGEDPIGAPRQAGQNFDQIGRQGDDALLIVFGRESDLSLTADAKSFRRQLNIPPG